MDKYTDDLSQKEVVAYRFVRNQLVHYNHAPSVREVMKQLGSNAPRSAELVINSLIGKNLLQRRKDNGKLQLTGDIFASGDNINTVSLPLVGRVAAGTPILAEENIEAYIPVDERLVKGDAARYYLLRVCGNSMDLSGINDGDLAIVKIQPGADSGQNIVALINDEATIKGFVPTDDKIILRPHSSDKSIQPIILHEDFLIRGVVVGTLPSVDV